MHEPDGHRAGQGRPWPQQLPPSWLPFPEVFPCLARMWRCSRWVGWFEGLKHRGRGSRWVQLPTRSREDLPEGREYRQVFCQGRAAEAPQEEGQPLAPESLFEVNIALMPAGRGMCLPALEQEALQLPRRNRLFPSLCYERRRCPARGNLQCWLESIAGLYFGSPLEAAVGFYIVEGKAGHTSFN